MRFPSNFFYLKKNNHLNGDVFSFVDFSRFESSRSPSVRRRSPTSKPRCRESDTRAVARVFSKLGFWILGGKTARGRGSRESHRIFTSPERWRRTLFFLNNWTRGMRSIVLYTHTHIYIYIYIWASHRAYFFARSCAEQRIQNRVLYPRRFLTNGASISMVVIYHNVLFARPADARIFARSSDFIFERFRVVDLPATSARPIPVGRSCRISASLEPSIKSTWSTKVLKNI